MLTSEMKTTDVSPGLDATARPAVYHSTKDCESRNDCEVEPKPSSRSRNGGEHLTADLMASIVGGHAPPHADGHPALSSRARSAPAEAVDAPSLLDSSAAPPDPTAKPKRGKPKKKNKNYAVIHSKPLPLEVHPLPAFHPTNPISLLKLCYVWLSQILSPPSSHPLSRYEGHFSPETRSVHVTDPVQIRALWEMGFFGKGTLSRSEPSWLDRAKAKAHELNGGGTAEEATNARREERRLFKLERARSEREKIERQRAVEEGMMTAEEAAAIEAALEEKSTPAQYQVGRPLSAANGTPTSAPAPARPVIAAHTDDLEDAQPVTANEEHLQLTLEEAFFLHYGLGVIDITTSHPTSSSDLLKLFAAHATLPPSLQLKATPPDNPFFINYVVYHHFRSLGWVVRSGLKFSCDYLLYQRGPVFSHAEFALLIIPSYSDAYWKTERGVKERRWKEKNWWWLHCVNRVQNQVKKTLVLVYVDVPAPMEWSGDFAVAKLLGRYKVREFVVRRWIANRTRD